MLAAVLFPRVSMSRRLVARLLKDVPTKAVLRNLAIAFRCLSPSASPPGPRAEPRDRSARHSRAYPGGRRETTLLRGQSGSSQSRAIARFAGAPPLCSRLGRGRARRSKRDAAPSRNSPARRSPERRRAGRPGRTTACGARSQHPAPHASACVSSPASSRHPPSRSIARPRAGPQLGEHVGTGYGCGDAGPNGRATVHDCVGELAPRVARDRRRIPNHGHIGRL